MKKFRNILAMLMVFVMLVAVMPMNVFAEPGDGGDPAPTEPTTFKVTFNVGEHGTAPADQNVAKDGKVKKPADPTAEGFKFEGWFEDDKLTKAYDFETAVTKEMTLYAKWSKEKPQPKPDTKVYTVSKGYTSNGSFTVSKDIAKENDTITVEAKPNYGYVVKSVYYYDNKNVKHIIKNYAYNDYYYYRYNDRYYNDYNYYYSDYKKYYDNYYATYEDYLRAEQYSFWKNYYRYDNRFYDRYDNYYYRYLDDYDRNYSDRYDNYEEYLYYKHRDHYRDYYDYRYDFGYYNYSRYNFNTSDTFYMPDSDVTVYVEFTDWSYYGYYYDDYYYYRYHRNKKDNYYERQKKAEEKAKEEEEAKAKAEAAKQPQVYENKAVIAIGSNVLDKVSKNVHTVHQMDTPAYVKDGRVMLPLRYVAEALGLQVSWVPETKTVIIWDLTQRVEIPVKSNRIIVNGITYTSDVKPEIKSSRTMLPIANIARALGLIDGSDIVWDQYNKQVTLTRKVLSK